MKGIMELLFHYPFFKQLISKSMLLYLKSISSTSKTIIALGGIGPRPEGP